MDNSEVLEILEVKLRDVDLKELTISDLTGIAVLGLLRRRQRGGAPVEGTCTVLSVNGGAAGDWKCRCFTSGTTHYSFSGTGLTGWVQGVEGNAVNGVRQFTATDPGTGQIFFVSASCS